MTIRHIRLTGNNPNLGRTIIVLLGAKSNAKVNIKSPVHITPQSLPNKRYYPYIVNPNYYTRPSESLKQQIRERDNYTCQICGKYGKDIDHIVPLDISHDNSPDNLRVLCRRCNLLTGNRFGKRAINNSSLDQWIKYLKSELEEYKERQLALDLV